jgi:small subunit ribosomal protein S6
MRDYELFLVIDADAEEEQANAIVEKTTQLIAAGSGGVNGEVTKVETRGKRRLSYAINRKVDGLDVVCNFRAPAQALPEIERVLKLDELVLRYLLIRMSDE